MHFPVSHCIELTAATTRKLCSRIDTHADRRKPNRSFHILTPGRIHDDGLPRSIISADVDVDSSSRFPSTARTNRHTQLKALRTPAAIAGVGNDDSHDVVYLRSSLYKRITSLPRLSSSTVHQQQYCFNNGPTGSAKRSCKCDIAARLLSGRYVTLHRGHVVLA